MTTRVLSATPLSFTTWTTMPSFANVDTALVTYSNANGASATSLIFLVMVEISSGSVVARKPCVLRVVLKLSPGGRLSHPRAKIDRRSGRGQDAEGEAAAFDFEGVVAGRQEGGGEAQAQ